MMAASPNMYSSKNPSTDPPVELISIPILYGHVAVSNTGVTFKDLLTKRVTVAIPVVGGSQHLIALQIKAQNPELEIIPAPGAAVGLQLVKNKEVDVYITGAHPGHQIARDFNLSKVFEIGSDQREVKIQGVTLSNFAMFALFLHKEIPDAQKQKLRACAAKIVTSPKWIPGLEKMQSAATSMTDAERDRYLSDYVKALTKNGF
jgi:tripartite-type tricarboxylate transporter receptor subunit TctC